MQNMVDDNVVPVLENLELKDKKKACIFIYTDFIFICPPP